MKGFGRNVRLLIGKGHISQLVIYTLCLLVFAFFCIMDTEFFPKVVEEAPTFLLLVMFVVMLIIIGMGEGGCLTMVYFGSSRRPAAWAMLLTQYVFLLEQLIILFVVAALVENNACMKVVRVWPLGSIAIVLSLAGLGNIVNALSIRGHKVCAGILAFILTVVFIVSGTAIEMSEEMFIPCNNIGVLLIGLAVTVIGDVVYFKTVTKVDLKLA